jgi:hypothetical protein
VDDLTLLQDLHREIPGPSDAEAASARARLLAAIGEPRSRERRRTVITGRLTVLGRLARPRFWAPAGAAAAVTAIVITAVAIATPAVAPRPQTRQPVSAHRLTAAAYALDQAASAAARQVPGQGPVFVAEMEHIYPDRAGTKPGVGAVWWSSGGSVTQGFPQGNSPFYAEPFTPAQVQHLPGNPGRLLAGLERLAETRFRGPAELNEFWAVCVILATYPASPTVRAAVYRAAATLPGLRLVSRAHDFLGRPAAEVYGLTGTIGGMATSEVMFFDAATGAFLGFDVYRVDNPHSRPRCNPFSELIAMLSSGYVGSTSQLPPGAPLSPMPVVKSVVGRCPRPGAPQPSAPPRS